MTCAILTEATSSTDVDDDCYTFRDDPESDTENSKTLSGKVVPSSPSATGKISAPCKVCGDRASGYHYGVTSCEGCKGFFRRSIQKQIEYRCLREGRCEVIRLSRNRCQYCRFKKCLSVGMSRDSVRYGRVPKRAREQNVESSEQPAPVETVVDTPDLAEIARVVAAAHRQNTTYTNDLLRCIEHSVLYWPRSLDEDLHILPGDGAIAEQRYVRNRAKAFSYLAMKMNPCIQRVVDFAKVIPGFMSLIQDDQLILLKLGFFEVWLMRVARFVSEATVSFDDGSCMIRSQLELAFDASYACGLVQCARNLNALSLTEDEVGLYCAAILLSPDRAGLNDVPSVKALQSPINDSLHMQVWQNHTNPGLVISALTSLMGDLKTLGLRHLDHLTWYKAHFTELALNPLFAEVYDIQHSTLAKFNF